jgi:hypothetical protein
MLVNLKVRYILLYLELLESLFRLVWDLELVGVEIFEAFKAASKNSEASKRLVGWFKYLDHQK